MVARVSGDEYTVILNRINAPEAVVKVAQKICHTLAQPFSFLNQRIYITASIGIALYPNNGNNIGALLQHADTALFRAKAKGGGSFQYYEFGMEAEVVRRVELERELRRAVERNELVLYYQPQSDVGTRTRVGMEALVRWQHPDRGLLPPGEFIDLAEESGIINQIGDWVLNEVCRQLAEWHDKGISTLPVAVNVASAQLESGDLAEKVRCALEQHNIDPGLLKLEITENTLVDSTEAIIQQMHVLKKIGVALEIDDFGTGYSSLSYLKRFPIDTIKIDRMFIKDLPDDQDDAAIVAGVITLAHNLGLAIIAEGVETEAQMGFLQQAGCDMIQGYLLSVPLPVAEIEGLMLAGNTSG